MEYKARALSSSSTVAPGSDLDLFMATMVGQSAAVAPELAIRVANEYYGVEANAERLTGERDENFRLQARDGGEYVLKVANPTEDPAVTELPVAALLHIETVAPDLPCPRVRRALDGRTQIQFADAAGHSRTARLVTYLQGKPLQSASRSPDQRVACGRMAAKMSRAFRGFDHPAARRALIWDLRNIPWLGRILDDLPGLPETSFIREFIERFTHNIAPRFGSLRHQFVHNDLNNRNVLVDPQDESKVAGVIDFGDAMHTALVADIAIATVGQLTGGEGFREEIADLLRGYQEFEPLLPPELEVLHALIAARMVAGVLIHSWHRARNPGANHFAPLDESFIRARIDLARRILGSPPPATTA